MVGREWSELMSGLADGNAPIAIVGMACRLPGANSVDEFWDILRNGRCSVGTVPSDRFDIDALYDPTPATPGKVMSRWGGFLTGIQMFDAGCFGISPREAVFLDPQQRLLLKTAWEALEDAGQSIEDLAGSNTGVFVGVWLNDYEARLFGATPETEFYMTTGTGRYAASGRISYCFGLEGPSSVFLLAGGDAPGMPEPSERGMFAGDRRRRQYHP
jgi:myxalamid-type polyketide synthase MxaE and MxaD